MRVHFAYVDEHHALELGHLDALRGAELDHVRIAAAIAIAAAAAVVVAGLFARSGCCSGLVVRVVSRGGRQRALLVGVQLLLRCELRGGGG